MPRASPFVFFGSATAFDLMAKNPYNYGNVIIFYIYGNLINRTLAADAQRSVPDQPPFNDEQGRLSRPE
jgi:hypothetical protein